MVQLFFINKNLKHIVHVENYNIMQFITKTLERNHWCFHHNIDLEHDIEVIKNLVEKENYTIDYKTW